MEAGTKVYRCEVFTTGAIEGECVRHYMSEATATGIEVDGVPMVKAHEMLFPLSMYYASQEEAKRAAAEKLRGFVSSVNRAIEELAR